MTNIIEKSVTNTLTPLRLYGRYRVSIVLPCYNETESVHHLAEKLSDLRNNFDSNFDFEFVFVDDGSSDDTFELLQDHFARWQNTVIVAHTENRGIAAAIMTGAERCSNEIICTIDSDCTYDPQIITQLVPLLTDETVVATASPYHPDGKVENVPNWRIQLSKMASAAYQKVFRNQIHCYTCCVLAFRRSALMQIELENDGFVGVTELLWKLECKGWRIAEYPAVLNVRQFGQSKMRTMQVAWDHMKLISTFAKSRFIDRQDILPPLPASDPMDFNKNQSTQAR